MYATTNAYAQYKQHGILTANPVELIVLLYDGCIKQLRTAAVAIEDRRYPQANTSLQKAQEIIMELVNSLDFNYEISDQLLSLYDFMLNEIVEINLHKETDRIDGIIEVLSSLRQAWNEIAKEGRGAVTLTEE